MTDAFAEFEQALCEVKKAAKLFLIEAYIKPLDKLLKKLKGGKRT